MNIESYHLIAHEVETNKEVFTWSGMAATRRFGRWDEMVDGDTVWQVVGVRNTSTQELWIVDVKRR